MDIITVLDQEGTVRYESHSVQRVLGYAPEELVRRCVFELVHPEDVARIQKVFSTGIITPARPPGPSFAFGIMKAHGVFWKPLHVT